MEKDYKHLWDNLRNYLKKYKKLDKMSDEDIMQTVLSQTMVLSSTIILKEMDRMQFGYANCEECGAVIEKDNGIYCDECEEKIKNLRVFRG